MALQDDEFRTPTAAAHELHQNRRGVKGHKVNNTILLKSYNKAFIKELWLTLSVLSPPSTMADCPAIRFYD